ncbi:hypothetical protein QJS04_geneDACA024173 [Acorus gramineus]|uniref:Embryonic stem cell-specific 5-hydroxymethylcytosine-binding protein n=1 Tax=Acorus gramineus TaxID=55184 RepID=A0AAV9AM67_ACOGR|nr:hypothetical protein QJS04_geneDACA024173 [Acorus gramineus]
MCGRARCTLNPQDIIRACGFGDAALPTLHMDRHRPSYNVSPGTYMPVIRREEDGGAILHCMKWGLVPSFTKKNEKPDHFRMFNARSESICEKTSFRLLVPKSRCLVAVEGFYEWKKVGSKKQPYYIHFKDDRPLVFAALYDSWRHSEAEILHTFTILTTGCSSALQWLHDRMPVILGNMSSIDAWINCPSSNLGNVLKPYEDSDLFWYPVTPAMGRTSFDGPDCIKEIQLKPAEPEPILKFFTRKEPNDEFQFSISSDKSGHEDIKEDLKKPRIEENNSLLTELQLQDSSHQVEAIPIVKKETEVHGIKSAHEGIKEELDEPKMKEKNEHLTELELVDDSDQIEATPLAKKEVDIHGVKREHEQFEVNDGLFPKKKRMSTKNVEDKQTTILSYFTKH